MKNNHLSLALLMIFVFSLTMSGCLLNSGRTTNSEQTNPSADQGFHFRQMSGGNGGEKVAALLPEELVNTIAEYFNLFEKETDADKQTIAEPRLVKDWQERYAAFMESGFDNISEGGYGETIKSIENVVYISDAVCYLYVVCKEYKHCMKIEKRNRNWFVTADAGNPYAFQPFGYDPALLPGPKGVLNLNNAYYQEVKQLMTEVLPLLLEEEVCQLSEMDKMPAVAAVKSTVMQELGLTDPRIRDSEEKQMEAGECFSVAFSNTESYRERLLDVLIEGGGCIPEELPVMWARIEEVPDHAPVYYKNADFPEEQTVGLPECDYYLVFRYTDDEGQVRYRAAADMEYASYLHDGKSKWNSRAYEYGFAAEQ